jgi:hypothetical protein
MSQFFRLSIHLSAVVLLFIPKPCRHKGKAAFRCKSYISATPHNTRCCSLQEQRHHWQHALRMPACLCSNLHFIRIMALSGRRYFSTKAVMPQLLNTSATSNPSCPAASIPYPPTGQIITALCSGKGFAGLYSVSVGMETWLMISTP